MGRKYKELKSKQLKRFELFKSQDTETGHFDVTFQIGEEKLYAHKFMLAGISKPFAVMFSERWTTKNEPIKICAYSPDDFKEFIGQIYYSDNKITKKNVFTMVDMAEFYDISEVKDKCDEFLSEEMKITHKNVVEMFEFSLKYPSLTLLSSSLMIKYVSCLLKSKGFLKIKKEMLNYIVSLKRFFSMERELFEAVYKWAEHQAILKQNSTQAETFDLKKAIKEDLTEMLPEFHFDRMDLDFLIDFVVPKEFLFSSNQDLSEILHIATHKEVSVNVITPNGKTLSGKVSCDFSMFMCVYDRITLAKDSITFDADHFDGDSFDDDDDDDDDRNVFYQYWVTEEFKSKPSKPSPLKKTYYVKFYLILDRAQNLAVKKTSQIVNDDYLLAELTAGAGGVNRLYDGCKIEAVCNF